MQGAKLKGDDSVEDVVQCMDHDSVLFFTSDGVVRSLKAHQIPQASRTAIGTAITQVSFPVTMPPPPLPCPWGGLPKYYLTSRYVQLVVGSSQNAAADSCYAGLAGMDCKGR